MSEDELLHRLARLGEHLENQVVRAAEAGLSAAVPRRMCSFRAANEERTRLCAVVSDQGEVFVQWADDLVPGDRLRLDDFEPAWHEPVGAMAKRGLDVAGGARTSCGAIVTPLKVDASYVDDLLRAGRAGELGRPPFPFGQYTGNSQLARELLQSSSACGRFGGLRPAYRGHLRGGPHRRARPGHRGGRQAPGTRRALDRARHTAAVRRQRERDAGRPGGAALCN